MLKLFRSSFIFSLFALLIGLPLTAVDKPITIGILDSAQQQILGRMLGIYLEDKGFQVSYEVDLSSLTRFRTMAEGRVDVAWEDPATVWFLKFLKVEILPDEELYEQVKELDGEEGL
ncbi:MAG: glycine betaine ABC transporter substrate-binding protein, partial [Candidatus Bipolaricaulia bacterium]